MPKKISQMTVSATLPVGGYVPYVDGASPNDNFIYDLGADLDGRPTNSELAASSGASLVGTTDGNVQTDLDAANAAIALRATLADLASTASNKGAGLVGMSADLDADYDFGTVGQYLVNTRRFAVNVEDYYYSTDGGSMHLAFERALATEARRINVGLDLYNLAQPIVINRDHVAITGPGEALGRLNMTGTAPYMFDIGDAVSQTYNVYIQGIVGTRTASLAGSKIARIRNVTYSGIRESRFFMDNKFGSAFDIQSGSYHWYRDIRFSDSIDETVTIAGGSAGGGGAVGGWCVGFRWRDCIFDGANAGKASPESQASFVMGDYVQALWMRDCEGYKHLGPLVDMRGTLPARPVNALNMFYNLNVEASNDPSCALRMENYIGTELSDGWCSGKGMPTIIMSAGAQGNRIQNTQVANTDSDCIEDSGENNRFEGNEFVGYGGTVAAVRWKSGSLKGVLKGGEVTQVQSVAINEAGTESYHRVHDVDSSAISGSHFTGFGAGSNLVDDYYSLESTPFYERTSATLDIPHGLNGKPVQLSGTAGNIDSLRAGDYYLEPVTLLLPVSFVVRDIDTPSGGNIVLPTSGASITGNGRNSVSLVWTGTNWRTF